MSDGVRVDCRPDALGWLCDVATGEAGGTRHEVLVTQAELDDLAPGASDPTPLVTASFEFLLEREPAGSILRRFALTEIQRYFPDYRTVVRTRVVR